MANLRRVLYTQHKVGGIYDGKWEDGELLNGTIQYDHGFRLEVSTRKLAPHGAGIMFLSEGTKIETTWKKGKPAGAAVIHYPDGTTINGKWKRTKANEIILMVTTDGIEAPCKNTTGELIRMSKQ